MALHVMDACALNAHLRGESGGDVVEGILLDADNVNSIHAVNLCEIYYDTLRDSDLATAKQTVQQVYGWGGQLRDDMDPAFWQSVGQLKVNPGKLSLADCFAVALAMRLGATLVTSDHHELDALVPLGLCPILFIR